VYEPVFTFHGFRYARVQGIADIRKEDVTPFLTRWLQNLSLDQAEDGSIPIVSPFTNAYRKLLGLMNMSAGELKNITSAGWGDTDNSY
jgi:hypothetical protein